MVLRLLVLIGTCIASVACVSNVISLSITPQPTQGASGYISPSFAGFGIEPSNLYSYTGGSDENVLTSNLLNNLANYTGTPPHLRIGGNTQDNMIYDADMNQYIVERNSKPVGQGNYPTDEFIIGPRFLEVVNRLPANTPITFGLNLAYEESDYIDRITTLAEQALNRLTDVNLVSFEIGNEPDLYLQNTFRSGAWNGSIYTQQWTDRANAVWEQSLKPRSIGSNFFEPACTASTIGTTFEIVQLARDGIAQPPSDSSSSLVASWNQHDYYYYIGVSGYPITQYAFMTLSTTNDQFRAWADQVVQAQQTGIPYALREMGVVGPIGFYGITDVFGASLWTLNFLLYAATLNITSVQMHMTDNSNASAWQPIEMYGNQPFIRPNYYAFAAFDQAIGPTCRAQIGGYILHDQPLAYQGRSAAYSIYQEGTLTSIVLINSNPSNITSTNRSILNFDLTLDSQFGGQTVYLHYLTNKGADARHGTTWNGISFEESGDGTPTTVSTNQRTVKVSSDGTVSIPVQDSEAVIANIGSPIGQLTPNQSACAALARSGAGARYGSSAIQPTSASKGAGSSSTASSSSGSSATHNSAAAIRFVTTGSNLMTRFSSTILWTVAAVISCVFTLVWL